ncbi:hypothetical protein NLX83_24375 [Allokutzneria sp. A3M-2-11 16]|uniref:hypothetical protein n=1 Tax=Allokutzneria sp. A3M-2-11 16 TaxID=2962043 RepID=UPI0020B83724|nr:hypothetical protein [Allokutzneria sp. A3M-2-11 16]MCP3802409.1 hypothetical protein [Allokutzneria sp. A3M-2-11 16]
MLNELAVTVLTPKDSDWGAVELRVLVDGRDIVAECFDAGPNYDPDYVLGDAGRLLPGAEPRNVRIAEAECIAECCGALSVWMSREGDEIAWYGWENSSDRAEVPDEFRFDAAQYEAELARAGRDRSWEWPARTFARLLQEALRTDTDVLGRWNSKVCFAVARDGAVELTFFTPPPAKGDYYHLSRIIGITDEPVEEQAERVVEALRARDPREDALILGGSAGAGALRGVKYRDRY